MKKEKKTWKMIWRNKENSIWKIKKNMVKRKVVKVIVLNKKKKQ
jgi:hypothetical protein